MLTCILIPAASVAPNSWEYMNLLLSSIELGQIDKHYEIVVAFDGCSDKFIDNVYDKYPFVRFDPKLINMGRPKNFCGNVNKALRILHQEERKNIILVNQDTVLPNYERFRHIEHEEITSATEVCLAQDLDQTDGLLDILNACQEATSCYTKVDMVTGFCLYLANTFLDRVGYLNEYLQAAYDDDDMCAKANLLDIPIYKSNIQVQHFQHKLGAFKETDLPVKQNQFNILWHIPLEIKHENFQTYIKENHTWSETYKDV